uniref:Uncharacterized protein n=1 Tax=Arundo donax TaxID=35708 RepID=A0A0A8Z0J4_ARUDO
MITNVTNCHTCAIAIIELVAIVFFLTLSWPGKLLV